jgi:hypothetical protein
VCADLLCEQYKLEGRVAGCAPRHGQAWLLLMGVNGSPGSLADTRESAVLLLARGPGNTNCHSCTHILIGKEGPGVSQSACNGPSLPHIHLSNSRWDLPGAVRPG